VPSKVARDVYDRLHKTASPGGGATRLADAGGRDDDGSRWN
jgi:hypothetical protein